MNWLIRLFSRCEDCYGWFCPVWLWNGERHKYWGMTRDFIERLNSEPCADFCDCTIPWECNNSEAPEQ